jgi:hypothetical protein
MAARPASHCLPTCSTAPAPRAGTRDSRPGEGVGAAAP